MDQVLLSQNGKDIIVRSYSYKNENELQEILKSNPDLINLSSIFESPIMIIGRESDYIDILAITASAVPVIIECKRKENPDMRYLIAQVFEYASKLNKKSYNELDQMATKYFASDRCNEEQYKNLSLKEAFMGFRSSLEDIDESYDEKAFVTDLSERLKNGEFYLIVVVDKISNVAFETIQFLNKKMEKLRIEIIEVSKFGDGDQRIYVPTHANRESVRQIKSQPGKTTLEEILNNSGVKEAGYIREIWELWQADPNCSVVMGTKGFSARYNDIPILWILPDYIQIAPRIKRKYEHLFPPISKTLKKYFNDSTDVTVKFSSPFMNSGSLRGFLNDVRELWKET